MIRLPDASVVVKWFCPEDPVSTARAAALLDDLQRDPRSFAVPELLYSECLHVLQRKLRGETKRVQWAMERLFRLSMTPLYFDAPVAAEAARAMTHGLSGYDATYYAFARVVEGQWLTFDEVAAGKVPNARYVCSLAAR